MLTVLSALGLILPAVPLPTYFILGDEFDTTLVDALPAGGTLCHNLHYLGRSGVQQLRLGENGAQHLSIAYLSGIYDPSSYFSGAMQGPQRNIKYQPNYIEEDVIRLMGAGLQVETVDVMLTAEWAKGWQMLLPVDKLPKGAGAAALTNAGSPVVAKLASQISTRYHFAGLQDTYFELPPYKSKHYVTRFFGLGKTQSASKEKNIYACSVNPYASIDLNALPPDMTPCPYTVGTTKPPSAASRASMAAAAGMGDVAGAAGGAGGASVTGQAHDFPTEHGGKRQRLDHAQVAPDHRFGASFMASMNQYDAHSMNAQGAMRWDFKKPQRGPPPHHYICKGCNEPGRQWKTTAGRWLGGRVHSVCSMRLLSGLVFVFVAVFQTGLKSALVALVTMVCRPETTFARSADSLDTSPFTQPPHQQQQQ